MTTLHTLPWLRTADELHCSVAALVELLGGHAEAASGLADEQFGVQRVARGASLLHEGAPAHAVYVVQSGSFKCVKTAEDGYEHVLGFAWRRDLLGYDGLAGAHYAFSEVALEDSRVVVLPLTGLDALRRRVPELDAALQAKLARQLALAGDIAEVMAAVAADVRLARFLVKLAARMAERGESARRLLLRMNRRDIANHLGLAHETISRSFGELVEAGWLRVNNRDVQILDPEGLRQCARCTRGVADETPLRCAA